MLANLTQENVVALGLALVAALALVVAMDALRHMRAQKKTDGPDDGDDGGGDGPGEEIPHIPLAALDSDEGGRLGGAPAPQRFPVRTLRTSLIHRELEADIDRTRERILARPAVKETRHVH